MLTEFLKDRTEAEVVLLCFILGVFILFSGVKTGQFIGWIIKVL